jgi:hypothetical protein
MNSSGRFFASSQFDPMAETVAVHDPKTHGRSARSLNLRAGEWVQVRSAKDILSTLDAQHCLNGLPFMPEMLQYCEKRFRVYKSAHKTCDTIQSFTIRRMSDAVHLEDLRCDGEAHGGCQASCLLIWKEAWLQRVTNGESTAQPSSDRPDARTPSGDIASLHASTRVAVSSPEAPECFRCQATEIRNATTEVRRRDRLNPFFYVRDLTSGNVRLSDFFRFGLRAVFTAMSVRWLGRRYPDLCGRAGDKTPSATLNLQPGELVQVRSKHEILKTLNAQQRNRGLYFDVEMTPYCESGSFRVLKRVEQIIDEKTGRMLKIPNACLILDGVTCSGHRSSERMFCPRSIYPYWREIWLERAGNK